MGIFLWIPFGFFIYVITYGLPWSRYSSEWTLSNNETIEEVIYHINTNYSPDGLAQATVYLKSNSRNKKLPKEATLAMNGQLIEPQYYNTGQASGYKYSVDLLKAKEYVLVIERAREEIKKVIIHRDFSPQIPLQISKSTKFRIPYTADRVSADGNAHFKFESSAKEPIMINDVHKFGLHLDADIEDGYVVIGTGGLKHDSYLTKDPHYLSKMKEENREKFKGLKNGKVKLYVIMIFDQQDGTFVAGKEQEVEIVD